MKKYITICCTMLLCVGLAQAQNNGGSEDDQDSQVDYRPEKGDFTGAILFGRGNFLNNVNVPASPNNNPLWTVEGAAPFANTIDGNTNNIGNIAGGEVRYFIKDHIAIKLSTGFIQRNTPALDNLQRFYQDENGNIVDGNDPSAVQESWIPSYSSINENQVTQFNITGGGEYHFPVRFNRLSPYVGLNLSYHYARTLEYDPTVIFQGPAGEVDYFATDIEERTAQVYGFGFQLTGGADFYLFKGLYCGFEVRPVSFIYARSEQLPSPGLDVTVGRTSTWASFAQSHFKIGFRF